MDCRDIFQASTLRSCHYSLLILKLYKKFSNIAIKLSYDASFARKAVKSSANILSLVSLPPIEIPFIVLSLRICIANIFITRVNKYMENGSPCLTLFQS